MRVGIGSIRAPKVSAVRAVFTRLQREGRLAIQELDFVARSVASEVSDMPTTRGQTMRGARGRAENLQRLLESEDAPCRFYIGLEGGIIRDAGDGSGEKSFLEGWAYATDGVRGYHGGSMSIEVPPEIAGRVLDQGEELGHFIDEYSHTPGVRDNHGAFGLFTHDLVTRQFSFELALTCALAPFLNDELYTG